MAHLLRFIIHYPAAYVTLFSSNDCIYVNDMLYVYIYIIYRIDVRYNVGEISVAQNALAHSHTSFLYLLSIYLPNVRVQFVFR